MPGVEVMFWVFSFVCEGGFGLRGVLFIFFFRTLRNF